MRYYAVNDSEFIVHNRNLKLYLLTSLQLLINVYKLFKGHKKNQEKKRWAQPGHFLLLWTI